MGPAREHTGAMFGLGTAELLILLLVLVGVVVFLGWILVRATRR